MKTFPIRVEKALPMVYRAVEWRIHNVCNYNCSFCASQHKDGSERWMMLADYKRHVDTIVKSCDGAPIWFQLTGGEPTLYPKIIELLAYIKSKGCYTSLITNSSRTLRWYSELCDANVLDSIFLTYHSDTTTNYKHVAEVAALFHSKPTEVYCLVTHVPSTIDLAFEAQDYFMEHTGTLINVKAMFLLGYGNTYEHLTDDQYEKFQSEIWNVGKLRKEKVLPKIPGFHKLSEVLKVISNNAATIVDAQVLMKTGQNKFDGWDCFIGDTNMRIEGDVVFRGTCGVGGGRKLDDPNLGFTTDSVKCTKYECNCGTDLVATKVRPLHMYPDDK